MNSSLNRGQLAVRKIKSLAVAGGSITGAIAYAQSQNWSNAGDVVAALKAAITSIGTDDAGLMPTASSIDFSEFIRPQTIIGKLAGLRRVPARVRTIAITAGSTAYWSGERQPRPISRMTLAGATLEPLSVTAIVVVTSDLLRSSAPSAESTLSRDLGNAAVHAMDLAFIDPSNAGIAGVKPASITLGAPVFHSSGPTLANIDNDLGLLVQGLIDAGSDMQFATWILRPRTALYLARLRGSGGAPAFPGMTARGGVLLGLPAITSAASLSDVGSPSLGGEITLVDPSEILVADDGGGALQLSDQTSLMMSDTPTSPATMTSLFQTESVALKVVRYANWMRTRAGMVQLLDAVAY